MALGTYADMLGSIEREIIWLPNGLGSFIMYVAGQIALDGVSQ